MNVSGHIQGKDLDLLPVILKHMRLECIGVTSEGVIERIYITYISYERI
jgi:hypothetical protein